MCGWKDLLSYANAVVGESCKAPSNVESGCCGVKSVPVGLSLCLVLMMFKCCVCVRCVLLCWFRLSRTSWSDGSVSAGLCLMVFACVWMLVLELITFILVPFWPHQTKPIWCGHPGLGTPALQHLLGLEVRLQSNELAQLTEGCCDSLTGLTCQRTQLGGGLSLCSQPARACTCDLPSSLC